MGLCFVRPAVEVIGEFDGLETGRETIHSRMLTCAGLWPWNVVAVRGLGTHISRVRSIKMDSWAEDQAKRMKAGGNDQCKQFFKDNGMADFEEKSIRDRYDSPQGELYKDVLTAQIEGKPLPTELPKRPQKSATPPVKRKMEGFGSSPPPKQNKAGKLGAYVLVSAFVAWYLVRRNG